MVDTERDRLRRVTATATYRQDGRRRSIRRAYVFETVDRTAVERPPGLGAPTVSELLWDAAGY